MRKVKKTTALLAVLVLTLTLLSACGGSSAPTELKVSIVNSSGYIFNELYVTPTAATEWGDDLLGSTSVLKKGGSYDITVPVYDYDTYDIRVIDEDDDTYLFSRVPLKEGCKVEIVWEYELAASVTYTEGEGSYVVGTFGSGDPIVPDPIVTEPPAPVSIDVSVYNNTQWKFDYMYVYPMEVSDQGDDVLYGYLWPDERQTFSLDGNSYYDIDLYDEDGDYWYIEGIYLENGCTIEILYDGVNPVFSIAYADGSVYDNIGTLVIT